MSKNLSRSCGIILSILVLLSFCGCGKHETEAGAAGTAAGAVIGAGVSGKKDKGTGATVGALLGNVIGRAIGRSADRQEARAEQEKELTRQEIRHVREKNLQLRRERQRKSEKWCYYCNRKVCLTGANSCPHCGHALIIEKYCRRCDSVFNPDSSYRYCPYCAPSIRLSCR